MNEKSLANKSVASKTPIIILLVIGFISGLLSTGSFHTQSGSSFSYSSWYIPGLLFGFGIACYFFIFKKARSFINLFAFLAISGIAYFSAVIVFISSFGFIGGLVDGVSAGNTQIVGGIGGSNGSVLMYAIGAAVGTAILLLGFHSQFMRLQSKEWLRLLLYGIALSVVSFLLTEPIIILFNLQGYYTFSPVILIWQTGMAGALGWAIATRE